MYSEIQMRGVRRLPYVRRSWRCSVSRSLKSRPARKYGRLLKSGYRGPNGLWPYQSSRGGRPLGNRIQRSQSAGSTWPAVNVMPPMTMLRLLRRFSAPYARSSSFA